MSKECEQVKFRNYEGKITSPFITYADFESILVPENNRKQNPQVFFTNNCQKHITCSFGYKLVCLDAKLLKTYLGKDTIYNFIVIKKINIAVM